MKKMTILPQTKSPHMKRRLLLGSLVLAALLAGLALSGYSVWARPASAGSAQASPLHPTFPLLDKDGVNVLESGGAISTMQTCGSCHDTQFISEHSYHASAGLADFTTTGEVPGGRSWDTSPGIFGKWDPLYYRYLTPQGDERLDMGTADWIRTLGARHVGGGPATTSRDGTPLTDLEISPDNPETNVLDPQSGETQVWDWEESGVVEMNCFLCHTPDPNNAARKTALADGRFEWANTATLLGSGLVNQSGDEYNWNPDAFQDNGELIGDALHIQDPSSENCGLCHGLVYDNTQEPLIATGCQPESSRTQTTGQIVSGQRLSDSGMNLAGKELLSRAWDVHAERLVTCTDCHNALNNPVYYQEADTSQPGYLTYDPRRLELGEYLYQPLHQFARGQSAQSSVAPQYKDTMRRCESCHDAGEAHTWLPYSESHMQAVTCESCHIPKMYTTAFEENDHTVIHTDGSPQMNCRGYEGPKGTLQALVTGYEPVLMPRQEVDGGTRIAPYNLITSWYWVAGDPERPVRQIDLEAAFLAGDNYAPEVLAAFDADGSGVLEESELRIDSKDKEALIAGRLAALGLENPHIVGEIQPYSINHDVAPGEWSTRDCQTCHSKDSKIYQPFQLAGYVPGGVMPTFVQSSNTINDGEIYTNETGALYYRPASEAAELYVFGRDQVGWIDLIGSLLFAGVLLGVAAHGGIRFFTSLRHPAGEDESEEVYMYTIYERLWHWLQTFAIVLLLFTGLIIHKPDTFGIFSFRYVVQVHNILAAILVINAALSLFYHLVSGEIKQYIPRPRGFFDQAITQAIYYLRGIFKNEAHPFEKTPQKKLNPLQQVTYFGILNVLLPLQVLTGALMWGAQRWPQAAAALGGLPFLAPFHTLIAWLFASFIVAHVYLTTTGVSPLAGIRSMMMGWDVVEQPASAEEGPVA